MIKHHTLFWIGSALLIIALRFMEDIGWIFGLAFAAAGGGMIAASMTEI